MSNNFYNLTDKQLAVFLDIMDGKHTGHAPAVVGFLSRIGLIGQRWVTVNGNKHREGWYVLGTYRDKYKEWSEEQ